MATETVTEPSGLKLAVPMRAAIILGSHWIIDAYSQIVPALLILIEANCHLMPRETSMVIAVSSFVSGLAQPACAALSDRFDSRLFGGIGLAVAAIVLCLIGRATNFGELLLLVTVGYIGVGIFHPIAASSVGQLSRSWRSMAMSGFFVAGMLGASLAARFLPVYVGSTAGLVRLEYLIFPGLLVATAFHFSVRHVSHRVGNFRTLQFSAEEIRGRWRMVGLLYSATAIRASVYVTLQYMFVRWVQARVAAEQGQWSTDQIANESAQTIGSLIAMMVVGMALGGLGSGLLIREGREKLPLVLVPLAFAPAIFLFPSASFATAHWLGMCAGIGFAAMSPVALSVSQRLLPHRTSFASSLMLGGAWAVGSMGPMIAQRAIPRIGIAGVFHVCAALLAASGILAVGLQLNRLNDWEG